MWPTSTCLGEIGYSLCYGPTPVSQAVRRCKELLDDQGSDQVGRASVQVFLAGLLSQSADFDGARGLLDSARGTYEELGNRLGATNYYLAMLGEVELLAGSADAAEKVLRELCAELMEMRDFSHLASRASDLAEALYRQGRIDEAETWIRTAEEHTAEDDLDAQVLWRAVGAKVLAARGQFEEAQTLAEDAVIRSNPSDALNRRARAHRDFGEVLQLGGKLEAAAGEFDRAVDLFLAKENTAGVALTRDLSESAVLV
jgi:tetratricopeptide (TPR) repeat protein